MNYQHSIQFQRDLIVILKYSIKYILKNRNRTPALYSFQDVLKVSLLFLYSPMASSVDRWQAVYGAKQDPVWTCYVKKRI
jgi:hypothetical protein